MQFRQWRISWLAGSIALSIMFGLVLQRFVAAEIQPTPLLFCAIATAPFILKRKFMAIVPCILFGLAFGMIRADAYSNDLLIYQKYQAQDVSVVAVIQSDPVYTDTGQTEFFVDKPQFNTSGGAAPGRLRIRTFESTLQRGDKVEVSGTLRDGFASWQGSIYYAEVNRLQTNNSALHNFRQNFIAKTYSVLPDPEASLGLGFLIGIRTLLPEELETQLSQTGLTHIVAVSGYNLTILILCTRRLFMRYSRYLALITSLGLLAAFLLITGLSPSIVRASVVSLLSLSAWYFGRQFNPVALLLFSGAITAYANPLYIWGDLGWYLSFLAFFGVLVLAPLVIALTYKTKQPGLVGQIFVETTMAQIMTAPLILFVFKEVSAISLLANVIVLPLIPLTMLGTFLSGAMALVSIPLSGLFVLPTKYLLTFITNAIALLANVPWALQEMTLTTVQFVSCFLIIGAVWFIFYKILRRRRNTSQDEFDILMAETE